MSDTEIAPDFEPAIVVEQVVGGGFRASVASVGIMAEGATRAAVLKDVDVQLTESPAASARLRELLADLYAVPEESQIDAARTGIQSHPAVTPEDFAQVTASDRPVLVEFWGPHCPVCLRMAPTVSKVAAGFGDRLHLVQMDAEQHVRFVQDEVGLLSLPTYVLYRNGIELARLAGARGSTVLQRELADALAG